MKVRTYLSVMAGAIVIPVVLLCSAALTTLFHAQREAAFHGLRETAHLTALSLDNEFSTAVAVLSALSHSPSLLRGDLASFYNESKHAASSPGVSIVLLDDSGQQLMNTHAPFGAPLPPPDARKRVQSVLLGNSARVSALFSGAMTHKLLAAVDLPITLPNGKRVVLAQSFDASYFQRTFPALRDSWLVGVFDQDGRTVTRSRPPYDLIGQMPKARLLEALQSGRKDVFRNDSRDSAALYSFVATSSQSKWRVAVGVPVDEVEAPSRSAAKLAVAGLLISLLLGSLIAIAFGRRLISAISAAGDSAVSLANGKLAAALSSPVDELHALHLQLFKAGELLHDERETRLRLEAEKHAVLVRERKAYADIDEEKAKNFELERAARALAENESQLKDRFLATLSHEIRNPLSAMAGAVALADAAAATPDHKTRASAILKRQMLSLTRIVDDLLDVARVQRGKMTMRMEDLDLGQVARACLDTLRAAGRLREHDVTFSAAAAPVKADEVRLEQIINNIVINALKYTPAGGAIAVAVAIIDDRAVLTVHDQGVGIAADMLPHVFDQFMQIESSRGQSDGGLGIGLALVKQLVQLHGGSVAAESAGVGSGSTFTVTLPLAR